MRPVVIVAFGDSTTAGTPLFESPLEAPPDGRGDERSQYAYWLMARHPDWRVLNRGVNGERSDQTFHLRILPWTEQMPRGAGPNKPAHLSSR